MTDEPLSAFVQRVWVARDFEERCDKTFVVQEIKRLEESLKDREDPLSAYPVWAFGGE